MDRLLGHTCYLSFIVTALHPLVSRNGVEGSVALCWKTVFILTQTYLIVVFGTTDEVFTLKELRL